MTAEPGRLLHARFRIGAELGRGGMAIVYRAHDELLDRDVALKVVRKPDLTPEDHQRLLREARMAARLNHPNIVSVHDAGEIDGRPFIVMELVEGASAFQQPPATLHDSVLIACQLCQALSHAHGLGIVHRDLKPENVLLTANGAAKLTDFGLAFSLASRITSEGLIAGTVFYLAPEQAQAKPIDGRSDLYALGVMLYEWVTGALPFTADDPLAVITQHLYAPVVPPRAKNPAVPPGLDSLIVALLSKVPDERPGSAEEVLERLRSPALWKTEAAAGDVPILERIGRGRLAGRTEELRTARRLWARALEGKAQALLISGEAGIGKTRMTQEIAAQAAAQKALVYTGMNYAQSPQPFAAFRQILQAALYDIADSHVAVPEPDLLEVLSLAPESRRHFAHVESSSLLDSPSDPLRLQQAFTAVLGHLAAWRPVLLIIEDAQWADSGTLALFRHLLRHSRDLPVLFILTYREVDIQDARLLHEVLLDLQRERLASSVRLLPLDTHHTQEMLENLFGEACTPEFLEEIHGVTDGNPFFIEEVCKAMVDSGRLTFADGRWIRPSIEELGVPKSLQVAIQSRLQNLPPGSRELVEVAAVRGREFEVDVVRQAARTEDDAYFDALAAAERAQIIRPVSGDGKAGFAFTHVLIPAAILEGMPPSRRRMLHSRIAPILQRTQPEEFELLAEHFRQAGDAPHAIQYAMKAGDRARGLYAFPEAIAWYTKTLELMRSSGQRELEARALMGLGLVYTADFRSEMAQPAFEQAFSLWEKETVAPRDGSAGMQAERLRFAVTEPRTLDPGKASDDGSAFILNQIFEGLVELDETYGVVPGLAARWDQSDDGRRYVFHLRRNLRWSDGTPLTAADFEYAWKRNLALAGQSAASTILYVVENARAFAEGGLTDASRVGVLAVDETTLEVRLERPCAYFPQLLAHPVTVPLARGVVEGLDQPWTEPNRMVSSGRYRLAESRAGERLVLNLNPHYRGYARGNVGRVECPIPPDYDHAMELFDRDELDGICLIMADPATVARMKLKYRDEFLSPPQLSTVFLTFLCDRPPFDDPNVRRAFIFAIDREQFAREAARGQYQPALGGLLPPGMPGHSPGIGLAHDPDHARARLDQAGFPGGRGFPRLSLIFAGGPDEKRNVASLANAWKQVLNVDVDLIGLGWAEFFAQWEQGFAPISLIGWSADYPDPDSMLRMIFHSQDGIHPGHWSNTEFDGLLEEAARIQDQKRRIGLYQEADRILVAQDAAILPLGYARGKQLVKPWVRMPRISPAFLRLKHVQVQRRDDR